MDPKKYRDLMEAYNQVHEKMEYERDMDHPKTTRETKAGDPNQIRTREPIKRPSTIKDKKSPKKMYPGKYQDSGGVVLGRKVRVKEELELDQMIESLVERGHTEQEAYTLVAQFTLDEAITSEKGKAKAAEMIANRTTASGRAKSGQGANVAQIKHIRRSNRDGLLGTPPNRKVAGSNWPKSYPNVGKGIKAARRAAALNKEEFEFWVDVLVEEGYDLSDYTWDEMYEFYLDEAITSEKGKAKAAEMIANRTTASGRAKSGQGANVAAIKHIRRANVDGYGGTPPNLKVAKNPVKSNFTGLNTGTGNKAARRAAALKKEDFELWVNELVEEGYDLSDYTWDEMYGIYEAEKPFPHEKVKAKQVALRDKGSAGLDRRMKMGMAVRRAKEAEKTGGSQRDAGKGWYHAKEDYVNESQAARNNPEKYEREQAKKSAPVRGEKTPMPPRGDKRREDFEKWYAKQMGR